MFVRILALILLLASPLMADDFDTLFYGDIEDSPIRWDSSATWPFTYRPHGGLADIDILETSDLKKRLLIRFSADGIAQVPDTNAVTSAKLYVKTSLFSVPYYLKVYALVNDRSWTEGTLNGSSGFHYGHYGATWMSPAQPTYPATADTTSLPASFDWRDFNMVSTVKRQGFCGSCWAHAAIAQVEAVHKKDVIDWTITNNSEDGTGVDRNVSPMLTPSPEITATGWEYRPIPSWLVDKWYGTSGWDNGVILVPDSGSVKVNTSEHASNKPHLIVNCVTRDDAFGAEVRLDITSSNLLDSYIQEATPTTNYGSADTALINSSNFMVIRADSFQSVIAAAIAADGSLPNDTFQYAVSCTLQLYMTKYSTNQAVVRAHQLMKNKFIEDSVTWNLYRGDKEWGVAGAKQADQLDLSEQQLVSCLPNSDCVNGGQTSDPFIYFRDSDSVLTEEAFRYDESATSNQIACLDTFGTAYAAKVGWFWRIPGQSENRLKQALLEQPLTVAHYINSSFIGYTYTTSNTCWYGTGTEDSSHAVELVGWDDDFVCDADGDTGVWIVKNQYGSGWGQDGFAAVSKIGHTNLISRQSASSSNASLVISVTEQVPMWNVAGVLGGSEVAGLVAVTPDIAANGWQAIDIPAWVIRAMINGKMSRTILLQAETEPNSSVNAGVQFASTKNTTSADRPYLVLKSIPESQFQLKVGNTNVGNTNIGR